MGINQMRNDVSIFPDDAFNEIPEGISIHAEVDALRGIHPENARGATVYVSRVLRDGSIGYSRPCPACEKYLVSLGIKRVVYT